jgi:hypothetical protein
MTIVIAAMIIPGFVALGFQFACYLRYKQATALAGNQGYGRAAGQHC